MHKRKRVLFKKNRTEIFQRINAKKCALFQKADKICYTRNRRDIYIYNFRKFHRMRIKILPRTLSKSLFIQFLFYF